jgi:hypothetical protein
VEVRITLGRGKLSILDECNFLLCGGFDSAGDAEEGVGCPIGLKLFEAWGVVLMPHRKRPNAVW